MAAHSSVRMDIHRITSRSNGSQLAHSEICIVILDQTIAQSNGVLSVNDLALITARGPREVPRAAQPALTRELELSLRQQIG